MQKKKKCRSFLLYRSKLYLTIKKDINNHEYNDAMVVRENEKLKRIAEVVLKFL
jgi:hypothetical protein